jgi:hypothetical protein
MSLNVDQRLSFTSSEGVEVIVSQYGGSKMVQLTLKDVDEDGKAVALISFLNKDEVVALISMLEKI